MRKLVYTCPDGSISVIHPVLNTVGEAEGFTEADAEQRAYDAAIAEGHTPHWVEETEIPSDRAFRGAWIHDGTTLGVHMPTAQEIHKENLRILRKPLLEALDTKYMKADESGDNAEKVRIVALKNTLRDITKSDEIQKATDSTALAVAGLTTLQEISGKI